MAASHGGLALVGGGHAGDMADWSIVGGGHAGDMADWSIVGGGHAGDNLQVFQSIERVERFTR